MSELSVHLGICHDIKFGLAGGSFEDTLISSNQDRLISACKAAVMPISSEQETVEQSRLLPKIQ